MTAEQLLPPQALAADTPEDPELEARLRLEQAARFLDLDDALVERLRCCEREITVALRPVCPGPVIPAYRVQHTHARGPMVGSLVFRGGTRLHQLRARAMRSTWQCALLELPMGGSAGAVLVDADGLGEPQLREVALAYVRALDGVIAGDRDIVVPQGRGAERVATWITAEFPQLRAVAGKPEAMFGLPAHANVAGRYVALLLEAIAHDAHANLRGRRVAIQGFGRRGRAVAAALQDAGAHVVAAADVTGAVMNPRGLDIPALTAHAQRDGALYGFTGGDTASNRDLLAMECDALLLAAAPAQITSDNVAQVSAALVLEAVPGAISSAAAAELASRQVPVVPELLTNASDSLAPYLEWRQAEREMRWRAQQIEHIVRARVRRAWHATREFAEFHGVTLDEAAMAVAVRNIAAV